MFGLHLRPTAKTLFVDHVPGKMPSWTLLVRRLLIDWVVVIKRSHNGLIKMDDDTSCSIRIC